MKPEAMNILSLHFQGIHQLLFFFFLNLSMELLISNFSNLGNVADAIDSSQWLAIPRGLFFNLL